MKWGEEGGKRKQKGGPGTTGKRQSVSHIFLLPNVGMSEFIKRSRNPGRKSTETYL